MNQASLLDAIRLAKEQGVTLIVVSPDEVKTPAIQITGNRFAEREPLVHTNKSRGSVLDFEADDGKRFLSRVHGSRKGGPYAYPKQGTGRNQTPQAYRFGCWLTEQMNKHGLSDKQLARNVGMSDDGIRHIRSGRNTPRSERQEQLEWYFAKLNGGAKPEPLPLPKPPPSEWYSGPDTSRDAQQTAQGVEFGRWLTGMMNRHSLTDRQMERATGIPHGSFGKMRAGGYIPNNLRMHKIVDFFAGLGDQAVGQAPVMPKKVRRHLPKRAPGGPYAYPKRGPLATDMAYEFARWLTDKVNQHRMSLRDVADATGINPSRINAMRLGVWFPPTEIRSKVEALFEEKPVATQASS